MHEACLDILQWSIRITQSGGPYMDRLLRQLIDKCLNKMFRRSKANVHVMILVRG